MRKIILLAAAVLALGYAVFAWATVDRRGDEAQIRSVIRDAADAVRVRGVNTIISHVSADYQDDSGLSRDSLRLLVGQALWDESQRYRCEARIEELTVNGDKAEVVTHATITSYESGERVYDRTLTLLFARESGRHAVILPVKTWRVIGSRDAGLDVDSLLQ